MTIKLPSKNTFQFCRRLKEIRNGRFNHLPVPFLLPAICRGGLAELGRLAGLGKEQSLAFGFGGDE